MPSPCFETESSSKSRDTDSEASNLGDTSTLLDFCQSCYYPCCFYASELALLDLFLTELFFALH